MKLFTYAHATHPQWSMAAGLVVAQLKAQLALPVNNTTPDTDQTAKPLLGIVYFTDHYAADAQDMLDHLKRELPDTRHWVGTVGVGIAANNVEYFDEPALAVMLCDLPQEQFRVFSGVAPLLKNATFKPHSALVHADGHTPDLAELLSELSGRTASGYLFGGLTASRQSMPQIALHAADELLGASKGVFEGGMSGVAFSEDVALISRVTQGCQPIRAANGKATKTHRITKSEQHVVLELDGEPALDVLLAELGITLSDPQRAVERLKATFVGLTASDQLERSVTGSQGEFVARGQGRFGADTRVRHLVGIDPLRRGIAVADVAPVGSELTFCERNRDAARRDLMRICAEIREELEVDEMADATDSIALLAGSLKVNEHHRPKKIVGAIYVSCAGRGGPHFGGDSAELQIVRHALGDVPLVGFFAGGEIAHQHLYGYTGVLTVFTAPA
jgi:small ligand-binding sensory domain FIST